MSQEDYPPGLQECVDHINWVISEAQKGVNPVNEQKLSRKWHLTNIKEWLALAQTPLLKAQQGVADALNELCLHHLTQSMVSGAEIAHTVNMAVVRIMHAMDLVELALTQLDTPSEQALPSEVAPLPSLYCDRCGRAFRRSYGVKPGSACPFCEVGFIRDSLSKSETPEPPIDKDKDHGDEDTNLMCTRCDFVASDDTLSQVGSTCPKCHVGCLYPDGIPF